MDGWWFRAGGIVSLGSLLVLQACTAVTAGQLVQAGYDTAKTSLTGASSSADAARIRAVINAISVGQDVAPILASISVPPKEKSGNLGGYVCYQYAGVYSATEDAVIVAKDDKVVFFGNSTCRSEMQAANFATGGRYASGAAVPASGAAAAPATPASGAAAGGSATDTAAKPADPTPGSN
ncbi:MAG TPA: hypothetical protein VHK04_01635 [Castellaniella sp.]|nr:hypothetical protein [Castellaniella sp.]